ncbi:hypothetical protein V7S43_018399 [Phytophthora oleae]|uniref:MBD domain-containing protein n=1 Tax=Phytophthora oleae TaxID=2107226 RepID=A0ABD3ERI1_9STRA
MAFQARWRELKSDGWTSKRPAGLSNDFFYIKPGKTKQSVCGEDFFIGENELMKYLDRIDIDELRRQHQKGNEKGNKASKTIEVQSCTEKQTPGRTSESSTVTQHCGDRSGQTPTGNREQKSSSQHQIAISPHVESDEAIDGSPPQDQSRHCASPAIDSGSSDVEPEPYMSYPSRGQAADEDTKESGPAAYDDPIATDTILEDPNNIAPGDNQTDYATLDSDGEGEGGSVYDDDEDIDFTEPDPSEDNETMMTPDLLFDPALLDAVGGVENVARGNVRASVLDDMKESGWTVHQLQTPYPYINEPYEARPEGWLREDYPGIYDGEHGPTERALRAASSPLGAFLRFVTPQLLERIAGESNDYFYVNVDERVSAQHSKQQARQLKRPTFQVQSVQAIKTQLEKTP